MWYQVDALAAPDRSLQVAPEHYDFEAYDDRERWMSYWYQLRAVLSVRPRTVLEIGPGTGVFRSYLQNIGVDVKTLDFDPSRKPDYVADITRLDETLPAGLTFDAVCAFQVLEHLPLAELERCLAGIARRAAPHVFVSLPYRGLRVGARFWWGDHVATLVHKFMIPFYRHKPIPEHHWELGWPHSARKLTKVFARHFEVVERGFVPENPYHYAWQLRVRPALTGP